MLKALRRLYEADKLCFPDPLAREQFPRVLAQAAAKKWQLFVKRPFKGPRRIVQYLGAYTHKIAISPRRILSVNQEQVHFAYKDYRHGGKNKSGHLSGVEFVRRFSAHVLPARFRRIRQYGFLLGAKAKKVIPRLQSFFQQMALSMAALCESPEGELADDRPSWKRCPSCHKAEMILETLLPHWQADTS